MPHCHRPPAAARVWKDFYRQWRKEEAWDWPASEPFPRQHQRVCEAIRRYQLPADPLASEDRAALVASALAKAAVIGFVSAEQLLRICPPTDEMLPP